MKVYAMYLPQFHRVKENDEWWGEGFTEWTAVKEAKPLFEGHNQPRIPLNGYYYDLMQKETMQWQANLMHEYRVDGLCFYHYWFKDGRQILEKPAENLLKWKDIDMPFCFSWANQTWARSWSKFTGRNSWANKYEKEECSEESGMLLEQNYGGEKEWTEHFDYLVSFFEDERYIKVDGRPLFLIFRPDDMGCLKQMLQCWKRLSKEREIKEPYVIAMNTQNYGTDEVDAYLFHEPIGAVQGIESFLDNGCTKYDYDEAWQRVLSKTVSHNNVYFGGFTGIDTTPRNGNSGRVLCGSSPQKFKKYMTQLLAKNYAAGNELVFVNAWNEWGEGMYLEPDVADGYGYLEAIVYAKQHYKEYVHQYDNNNNSAFREEIVSLEKMNYKYYSFWRILDKWLYLKEEGKSVVSYLKKCNYNKIAIYGMGMLGKHLLGELQANGVCVDYIVDRKTDAVHMNIPVYLPTQQLPQADVIIVTPTYDWDQICSELQYVTNNKLLRLDELIENTVRE